MSLNFFWRLRHMPTEHRQLIAELLAMYRKDQIRYPGEAMTLDNPNAVKLGVGFIELGKGIIHSSIPIYNHAATIHYLAQSWRTNCFAHYHHLQPRHIQTAFDALAKLSIALRVVYEFLHELNNDPPLSLVRTEFMANNVKRFHPMPSAYADPRRIKILLNREANTTLYDTFYSNYLDKNLCQMINWHLDALSDLAKTSQPANHLSLAYSTLNNFLSLLQKPLSVRISTTLFNHLPFNPKQLTYQLREASKAQQRSTLSPKTPGQNLIEMVDLSNYHPKQNNGFIYDQYVSMLQQTIAVAGQSNCLNEATAQLNTNPYYRELKELICDELCHEGPLTETDLYNFTLKKTYPLL